ncbi:MAG: nucleotidyltransferase family protein [Cyanobacteria bacterium SZAS LIN-3]|nr:nucleotidyltransferase family protein [Cyanobacteria bacterium SZAS LIN-3]
MPVLRAIRALGLPDWWLAGGAVRNTVWCKLFPADCRLTIKDFDIAFFDSGGTYESEIAARDVLLKEFPHLVFDVKNQASFGVWRPWHFTFEGTADGIAHWLHTATAVGIRLNDADEIEVLASYGLSDLFEGVIRPTPHCAKAEAAELKKLDFLSKCPGLVARDWPT